MIKFELTNLKSKNITIEVSTESTENGLYYGILFEIKENKYLEYIPLISGLANIFNLTDIIKDNNFLLRFETFPLNDKLTLTVNTFSNNLLVNSTNGPENNLIQMELGKETSFSLSSSSINEPIINIYSFENI